MREPVRQEESQTDREDGQWVEQQALEDAETIALLRWAHCDLLILQEIDVVPIPTVTPSTVGSAEELAIGEPFL